MESYQKSTIKDELEFINNRLQNAMSLYNKEVKIATLKATPQISKYFEKNMKKFLPTQEFKEKLDDGSIIFTVKYTQPLEILPFIQKWLPDLIIQAPNELKETYKIKLLQAVKFYNIN